MLVLQFTTATANLASQNALLFLATHVRSNLYRLILLCHSNPAWIPVSPLELLSHPSARCEDDRYKVHTTLLA